MAQPGGGSTLGEANGALALNQMPHRSPEEVKRTFATTLAIAGLAAGAGYALLNRQHPKRVAGATLVAGLGLAVKKWYDLAGEDEEVISRISI